MTRNEFIEGRAYRQSGVLLDGHRFDRGNAWNINATDQGGPCAGHQIDWGIVTIIQAPITHQASRVGGQGRIGLCNEFGCGQGAIPNPDLIHHAVEPTFRPVALANVAEPTTDRCRTVHSLRADQTTIKVQERSPTAMHRCHVSPSVQRQRLTGGQTIGHSSPMNPQMGPATAALGECQNNIVRARSVAEVQDTAPVFEAPRINPTFDGEIRITEEGIVAHVDVVHISLEGQTERIARLVIEAGSVADILLIPDHQIATGRLAIGVGHSNAQGDSARSRRHVVGRGDGHVAECIASAARGNGHPGQGNSI